MNWVPPEWFDKHKMFISYSDTHDLVELISRYLYDESFFEENEFKYLMATEVWGQIKLIERFYKEGVLDGRTTKDSI